MTDRYLLNSKLTDHKRLHCRLTDLNHLKFKNLLKRQLDERNLRKDALKINKYKLLIFHAGILVVHKQIFYVSFFQKFMDVSLDLNVSQKSMLCMYINMYKPNFPLWSQICKNTVKNAQKIIPIC